MMRLLMTLISLVALMLTGCSPVTLSVTLFADNARLQEVELERERGATEKIALIDVRGLLVDGRPGFLLGRPNPVDELAARLKAAENDRRVAAVIVRINSPGGSVAASEMMYREIAEFSERTGRPVVASFGEVAASGGYYIALAADHIVSEPTSITGSIGVIVPTFNISQGLNRLGIYSRSVTSVGNKDIANPFEPMNEEHYAILQAMVDEFHGQFQGMVATRRSNEALRRESPIGEIARRSVDTERLSEIADGRIMTGLQALHHGLVDETGGIREAFAAAKALAGLEAARLVKYHRLDSERPRTPYAAAPAAGPAEEGIEVSMLQIRGGAGIMELQPGLPYFLYVAPASLR